MIYMKLTRRQSITLALAILIIFFGVSIALIDDDARRGITELSSNSYNLDQSETALDERLSSLQESGQNGPAITLNKFHRSETKNGKKLWEISASSGQYLPENQSAIVENATLLFFQEDGKVIELAADQAKLTIEDANLNNAEIEGSVKVTFNKEISLSTDEAVYDRLNNLVTAPGLVKIESDMIEIIGEELEADLNKQEFILKRNVSSVIKARYP